MSSKKGISPEPDPKVIIDNRGQRLSLPLSYLRRYPDSRLCQDSKKAQRYAPGDGICLEYFRNPTALEAILDFYIDGELHFPEKLCWKVFERELDFWGVDVRYLALCCQRRFLEAGLIYRTMQKLQADWERHMCMQLRDLGDYKTSQLSWQKRGWFFFEDPGSSIYAKVVTCSFVINIPLKRYIIWESMKK